METEENKPESKKIPQPKGEPLGSEGFKPTEAFLYKAEYEQALKWIKESISNVNFIMGVIIVVLAVGFITMFISVASLFFQWNGMSASAQADLKKSIIDQTEVSKQLIKTTNKIETILNKIVVPTPSSSQ